MSVDNADKGLLIAAAVGAVVAVGFVWNKERYPNAVTSVIRPGLPALEARFGVPKAVLGGGTFGQAFDMGNGRVVKVTAAPNEAITVRRVIALRKAGHELRGLVSYKGEPVLLGKFNIGWRRDPSRYTEPLYAISTELVDPLSSFEIARIRGKTEMPRENPSNGTPFQFASETAQSWADAKSSQRGDFVKEYLHWVRKIRDIEGFDVVGSSMEDFLALTGIPLWDVRPENCGRIRHGDRRIVCFDVMIPEKGDGSLVLKPRPRTNPTSCVDSWWAR